MTFSLFCDILEKDIEMRQGDNIMELKILDTIAADFSAYLKERKFKEADDIFSLDAYSVKLEYSEEKKILSLKAKSDDGEFAAISDWLVDENTSVSDAKSVVLDFSEATDKLLGIKKSKVSGEIKLPQKANKGETPNAEALCQKFLAVFPQYKDTYKLHIAEYGAFLPITFFKATAAVELKNLLEGDNNKALSKMINMLSAMYAEGDREVGNLVAGVIIAGAVKGNDELLNKAIDAIDSPYLKPAVMNIAPFAAKNKKLKKVLE